MINCSRRKYPGPRYGPPQGNNIPVPTVHGGGAQCPPHNNNFGQQQQNQTQPGIARRIMSATSNDAWERPFPAHDQMIHVKQEKGEQNPCGALISEREAVSYKQETIP